MFFAHLIKVIDDFGSTDPSHKIKIDPELFRRILAGALRNKTIVDEKYYLEKYPDVAKAVASGKIVSASDHWYETGFYEGRHPRRFLVDEEYYLQSHPDVAKALRAGKLTSCQAHFDDAGFAEGRMPFAGFSLF
jgi:hypothetical protein